MGDSLKRDNSSPLKRKRIAELLIAFLDCDVFMRKYNASEKRTSILESENVYNYFSCVVFSLSLVFLVIVSRRRVISFEKEA